MLPIAIESILTGMTSVPCPQGMSGAALSCYKGNGRSLYLKTQAQPVALAREYALYTWLQGKLPLPHVLLYEEQAGTGYILMEKAAGQLVETIRDPSTLITLCANALNALWAVPINNCPHKNTLPKKLEKAKNNLPFLKDLDKNPYTASFKSHCDLFDFMVANQPPEDLVFTHGDLCLDNFFANGNTVSAFIDVGRGGIADRFQDISLLLRELEELVDKAMLKDFYRQINCKPNEEKLRYYTLLDEFF